MIILLEKIKNSLRIKHNAIDEDIQEQIEACKLDLNRVGIKKINALIIQITKLYVKWHLNYEGEADRYMKAYELMRNGMSLDGDYNV